MSELQNECRVARDGETVILAPTNALGELNFAQFERDTCGAMNLLKAKQVINLIIDLNRANHIGSNTINLFLQMNEQVKRNQGSMILCRVPAFVREVLEIMNVHQLWPICSSREEAMQVIQQRITRILVVDDSATEQCLIGSLLKKEPAFEVQYAEDGIAALKMLKETIPDIVLTDLMMPRMDGLELLDSIRRLYPQTPVILMTAYGNQSLATDALERGAVSYISKANRATQLVSTVKRIVRGLTVQRRGYLGVVDSTIEASFCVDNDHEQVCRLVDLIQQLLSNISTADSIEQLRVGVAVEEALLNALYHGNLEITPEQWEQADQNHDDFHVMVERLRYQLGLSDRRIFLDVKITNHAARFVVRDQGPGFDASALADLDHGDCFESGRHRGSMLMSTLMDHISYNDRGNELTLVKFPRFPKGLR